MTGDDTERRKQLFKQVLRSWLDLRRLGEKLRPSTPEAVDQRWKEQQLRWEVEYELHREEEEAAAKRRQQESAAPPPADPPPAPKLKDAPEKVIMDAVRDVYSQHPKGEGPSLKNIVKPVLAILKMKRLKASERRIQAAAGNSEFDGARGQPGKRRS